MNNIIKIYEKVVFRYHRIIITFLSTVFAQDSKLLVAGERAPSKNIKQLTFGGENAEAYFSSDSKQLIFQSKRDGRGCDQIYSMNIDGSNVKMISNGEGRTTCSYFFKNGKKVVYASTHGGARNARQTPIFQKVTSGRSILITISTLRRRTAKILRN